jgi:signal transduction histidine kinase
MFAYQSKRSVISYVWRTSAIIAAAAIFYYIPTILTITGVISINSTLNSLHNFSGIDLYTVVFFAPVAYAAYTMGTIYALAGAFTCMVLLFPYTVTNDGWTTAMLQPTALGIILGAVGAAISMLQRSEEQQKQRITELSCLYKVGRVAGESKSVREFIESVVKITANGLPGNRGVRITLREGVFGLLPDQSRKHVIAEYFSYGEGTGTVEIYFAGSSRKKHAVVKTLAERISGAIREINLQQSLNQYYHGLEEIIDKKSRELESAQEKLIRSERLAAVGALGSAVSHELRNPLNVIQNCVYLLNMSLENETDKDIKTTLNMINQQVIISNRIVTDLLDFARVKPPERNVTEISELVDTSLGSVAIPWNIKISKTVVADGLQVSVDGGQVVHALNNIILNAVEAITGEGEINIKANLADRDKILIEITDNGCGISPENLEKVFEPLFTTKTRGIGLGLAITRRLIELNGGRVSVVSKVNKGTTFTVELPIIKKEVEADEVSTECIGCR